LFLRDKAGNTPLHIAYKYSNDPHSVGKFLIENGVDITIKNNKGLTATNILDKRIEKTKNQELTKNSEKFLEPFQTIAYADDTPEDTSNEMLMKLNGAKSELQKAHVNMNKDKYNGLVSAKDKLNDGPVEFDKYGCYPYANIENEKEKPA
jgi:hypothetical protein